jgi:lipoate-protein ligase A
VPALLIATETTLDNADLLNCRLIIDPPSPGPWNMGIDHALLADSADNGVATLRFYGWSKPTLSLGYFQRYEARAEHPASLECAVVRRQTGGGAILHDRELTYSLTLPAAHAFSKNSQQLYTAVHDSFIAVLAPMLTVNDSWWLLRRRAQGCSTPAGNEPFLCFQRRACGDIMLEPNHSERSPSNRRSTIVAADCKILGSAQRRHRGAILQHGSLLLEKSPHAPELAGWRDLTGIAPNIDDVFHAVASQLCNVLRLQPVPFEFSRQLESTAADLANNKYGSVEWTKRR